MFLQSCCSKKAHSSRNSIPFLWKVMLWKKLLATPGRSQISSSYIRVCFDLGSNLMVWCISTLNPSKLSVKGSGGRSRGSSLLRCRRRNDGAGTEPSWAQFGGRKRPQKQQRCYPHPRRLLNHRDCCFDDGVWRLSRPVLIWEGRWRLVEKIPG